MGAESSADGIDLLVVGPESRATGGVARYVTEQRERLPDWVAPRVYDVGTPEGEGWRWFLAALLVSLRDAALFPARSRPDAVHVHSSHGFAFYRASFYVLFAAVVWRRPVVLHVHGSSFDDFVVDASLPVRLLQSAVFGACDRIVVLSEYWRDVLAFRASPEKLVVIPNAVDADEYRPAFDGDRPHVAFVSNHVERKGISELTDAVDALKRNGAPPFRVSIAGDGPLSDRAEALAERHDGVDYRGYVSEAEKRALLDSASIYVLPTHGEGLPIALLEGMAGGNAVVTTGVGSIPEVVDEENGVLVDPGDSDDLAAALADLLADPDAVAAMGRTNREAVSERYSWRAAVDRLTDTYRAVARPEGEG
ncbi:glycosyltransferase family 4 protein [Halostella litorea]|uniref:glycosyltransferase family 4 protein n=1 Tax=Halostella litorea TaxID=2528831 RepID=UPI00109250EE|nr:glycosyltransferase family 4 protein [Halostella litorea]